MSCDVLGMVVHTPTLVAVVISTTLLGASYAQPGKCPHWVAKANVR
jgi:hypothetical protein